MKKLTPWNKGKLNVFSEEAKTKMREAKLGKAPPPHKVDCKCFRCSKVPWNKGIPYSKGHRFKPGPLSLNWKGGISLINDRKRNDVRKWRRDILMRDNFTCVMCHSVGGKLHAHHIKKFSDYPELRTDINNGVTLCEPCHKSVRYKEREYEQMFKDLLK